MASMNVSLPESMRQWVEARIDGGSFATASDYVGDLIRRDKARAELISALEKGEQSGTSVRQVREILAALRVEFAGGTE